MFVYVFVYVISKHLMLLFNHVFTPKFIQKSIFQNISCYCLTLMEVFIINTQIYFKTSHVIV